MALDATTPRSRRALLAAGLGAGAATVASALASPSIVRAGADGDVTLNATNDAVATTAINSPAASQSVLWANATNPVGTGVGLRGDSSGALGVGVWGRAPDGRAGVLGESTSGTAVEGRSSTGIGVSGQSVEAQGVFGSGKAAGVEGTSAERGVFGHSFAGIGVYGASDNKYGLHGHSVSDVGVYGTTQVGAVGVWGEAKATSGPTRGVHGRVFSPAGSAVLGYSGTGANPAPYAKTGVYGYADQDASSRGAIGRSPAGIGVNGISNTGTGGLFSTLKPAGAAVFAGVALEAQGRVRFPYCAKLATINKGFRTVKIVPLVQLTASSSVVATLQDYAGGATVERVAVHHLDDYFVIWLNKPTTANVRVAWHLFG